MAPAPTARATAGVEGPVSSMPVLVFIALVLAWPLVEIAAFIWVGGQIGILPTLALIVLSTLLGFGLVRRQGLPLLAVMRANLEMGQMPARAAADAAMIAAGGALLMLPGFVTDVFGLLLFVPPVRGLIFHFFARRITVVTASYQRQSRPARPGVIDLDREDWDATSDTRDGPGPAGADRPADPSPGPSRDRDAPARVSGPTGATPWTPPSTPSP